jgi:nucleoid DNA-binding protein
MIQIENYISSFLLKNKYCAISGLGTLELKRDAAQIRNDEGAVYPPNYKINFSPIGVIDDGFATFIANHENVSISKASNDIKTFSQDVKRELRKTGRYELDGVGHFTMKTDQIEFFQDDTLDLEQDPIKIYQEPRSGETEDSTLANAKSFKDLDYTHSEKGMGRPKMGTLLKYLLSLLLLIGMAAGAYFAYKYYASNKRSAERNNQTANVQDYESGESDDTTYNENEALTDGEANEASSDGGGEDVASATPAPRAAAGEFNVAVISYDNKVSAKVKADKLVTYGNKASTIQKGDRHYVVITAAHSSNDTTILKDSLRRFFNPSGQPFIVK